MKICKGVPEKTTTCFADLAAGDVYVRLPVDQNDGTVLMKLVENKYTYLVAPNDSLLGYIYSNSNEVCRVARYPNACITLGEPE